MSDTDKGTPAPVQHVRVTDEMVVTYKDAFQRYTDSLSARAPANFSWNATKAGLDAVFSNLTKYLQGNMEGTSCPGPHSAQKLSVSTRSSESSTEKGTPATLSSLSLKLSNEPIETGLPISLTSSSMPKHASSINPSSQTNVTGDAKEIIGRLGRVQGANRRLCLDAAMMIEYLWRKSQEQESSTDLKASVD